MKKFGEPQITVDSQLLHQLFLGNTQDAGVAKLLESVLNQVLQAQATEQLRAEPYERTEERKGYRNGTYPHQLSTRHLYASRPPDSRQEVLSRAVCPLPTQRTSSGLDLDGDGRRRGVDAKGSPDYGRIIRYGVFEIHGVRTVQVSRTG